MSYEKNHNSEDVTANETAEQSKTSESMTISTDKEYLKAINEIIMNHSADDSDDVIFGAHWWADQEKQSIVLANDEEQYAIAFSTIADAERLHFWVEHLSRKWWIGKKSLEELVSV